VNKFAIGFRWAVIAGILQDWFFALPGIFIPSAVLQFANADPVVPPVWPAYASLLLMLVSLFCISAAIDPFRYSSFALLTVIARVGGVIFFFLLYPGAFPPLFGYIDLTFALLQSALLVLAMLAAGSRVPESAPAAGVR
jgi:hypothetical protein